MCLKTCPERNIDSNLTHLSHYQSKGLNFSLPHFAISGLLIKSNLKFIVLPEDNRMRQTLSEVNGHSTTL